MCRILFKRTWTCQFEPKKNSDHGKQLPYKNRPENFWFGPLIPICRQNGKPIYQWDKVQLSRKREGHLLVESHSCAVQVHKLVNCGICSKRRGPFLYKLEPYFVIVFLILDYRLANVGLNELTNEQPSSILQSNKSKSDNYRCPAHLSELLSFQLNLSF